jgi:regulatory protein
MRGRSAAPTDPEGRGWGSDGPTGAARWAGPSGDDGDASQVRAGRGGGQARSRGRAGGADRARRRQSAAEDKQASEQRDLAADPEAVARAICLRLLNSQPRTRSELAVALAKGEVPQDAAEAVLARFTDVGLIDDEAFAAAWVDSRHIGRGLSRRALAGELRRRGVAAETVDEAVERVDPAAEEATARALVRRRLGSTSGLDPAVRARRLIGQLARRGYSAQLSYKLVREELALDESPLDGEVDVETD